MERPVLLNIMNGRKSNGAGQQARNTYGGLRLSLAYDVRVALPRYACRCCSWSWRSMRRSSGRSGAPLLLRS